MVTCLISGPPSAHQMDSTAAALKEVAESSKARVWESLIFTSDCGPGSSQKFHSFVLKDVESLISGGTGLTNWWPNQMERWWSWFD